MRRAVCRLTHLTICCALATGAAAEAQSSGAGSRRVALDTVVGAQDYIEDAGAWKTNVVFDPSGSVQLARRLQVTVRPLFWRAMTGEWSSYLAHASVRYEFQKGSRWRLEAGKFPSPAGLGMTENRANLNDALIWWHRGYYGTLPPLGVGAAPHALISSIYPYGLQVHTSTNRWDARLALIDRAPVDFFRTDGAPVRLNGVVGGGYSPRQGLRLGATVARGRSGDATLSDPYTLVNVEGEYAFGYTKVSGEWTRDTFETPAGDRVAQGLTLQARQTVAPRVFVHSRVTTMKSPVLVPATGAVQDRRMVAVDTTVGYLVSPEATFRLGHAAVRRFSRPDVDHQVGASVVWSRRWW